MNFKLTPTTKDFFDLIRAISSYFSIATIGIAIAFYALDKDVFLNMFKEYQYIPYSIASLLVLSPIFYSNNKKKLNNYPSLIKTDEKFLMYSATLKDTFIAAEEYWDLLPRNYCMFYNITILFPEGKKVVYARLYK